MAATQVSSTDKGGHVRNTSGTVGADVQGHTDAQGGEAANQALSQERAEAVEAYLLAQGVADDALTATGFGEGQPIASNDTADGRARNRRVVFALRRL